MNSIPPNIITATDPALPTLPVDNAQPIVLDLAAPTDFSKLLAKQELPEFMLSTDLPTTLPIEQKIEKTPKKETQDLADDSDTQAQVMSYIPCDISPVLGQIDHLIKTSQAVSTDQISESENTTPDVIANNFQKPDVKVQTNIQNAPQSPDSTVVSQEKNPDTVMPVVDPVVTNDFEKLLVSQDEKIVKNNEIDSAKAAKPKSNTENRMTAILTDSNLQDPEKILASAITAPSSQQLPDMQDNKYMNVLSQFGSFISSQTTQHINNDSAPAQTLYTNTQNSAETFRKTPQLEMETKIELLPATLDGLNKETYNANIKIYPPELGNVLAKLKVDKGTAELVITADNNVVKQIIEAHLPQLRENFQSADITLTHVHVQTAEANVGNQENSGNQQSNQADNKKEWNQQSGQAASTAPQQRRLNSIIDTYA